MARPRATLARLAVLVLVAAGLGACESAPAPAEPVASGVVPPIERAAQPAGQRELSRLRSPLYEPIIAGDANGLEVQWWLADDTDGAVAQTIAGLAPVDDTDDPGRAWRDNGIRFARVPIDELQALQRGARPVTDWRRTWFGVLVSWTEVFRGRRAGGDAPVLIDARPASLDPGVLRILARCWPAPAPDGGPQLRLELAVQLHRPEAPDALDAFTRPQRKRQETMGTIFRDLLLETRLRPGEMLVVTCDDPDAQWTDSGDGAPEGRRPLDERLEPDPPPIAGPGAGAGPSGRPTLTVGQTMLGASALETGTVPGKVVLLLIPRLDSEFRLLPRAADDQR